MIKFTVVTCTYNAEKVLQRTLDSVQRQTYCNIEHIIMDGGSRDRTLQLVKAYQHRNAVGESSHEIVVISEPDKGLYDAMNKSLKTKFNTDKDLVKTIMNYQVFFNTDIIEELGLDYAAIKQVVVDRLKKDKDVHYAFDMEKTSIESIPEELKFRAINGYNRERSGGVQIVLKPGHYDYYSSKGTTHGAWNPYDIHIPCLFMGWGIQHGESAQPHYMTDIAATVCAMLHIQAPNGCIGTPIF